MIKSLIRLQGCAGWSAPLFFAIKKSQGFSCLCPYDVEAQASWPPPGYAPGSNSFVISQSKHNVVGTQMNRLIETVTLSTLNIC